MNPRTFLLTVLASFLLFSLSAFADSVSNVHASLSPEDALVIEYDLEGTDAYYVSVSISTDGGTSFPIKPIALSGDVGGGVPPGKGKKITWDVFMDMKRLAGDVAVKIIAERSNQFENIISNRDRMVDNSFSMHDNFLLRPEMLTCSYGYPRCFNQRKEIRAMAVDLQYYYYNYGLTLMGTLGATSLRSNDTSMRYGMRSSFFAVSYRKFLNSNRFMRGDIGYVQVNNYLYSDGICNDEETYRRRYGISLLLGVGGFSPALHLGKGRYGLQLSINAHTIILKDQVLFQMAVETGFVIAGIK